MVVLNCRVENPIGFIHQESFFIFGEESRSIVLVGIDLYLLFG